MSEHFNFNLLLYPLQEYDPVKRLSHGLLSSSSALLGSTPFDCSTPMSMDTAYSSMHQDTPCSFWQDTPHGSPMSHSNPGTPPHCEGLTNTTDTHTDTNIPHSTPFLTSESQHTYHNPHLVQLTPNTSNTRQGPLISITQISRTSQGHMGSGGQSHKVGKTPRCGPRDRLWGPKYQNAYNRRPEHRYVHRPGFNRSHYRSGCTTNLVPLVISQGPSAAQTQPDVSLAPFIQCSSSTNKPTGQTVMEAPTGNMDKEPIPPVSQRGNLCEIQTLFSEPLGKTLDFPQKTPPTMFNSPPHLPEVQQQGTAVIQTPERCVSPETEKGPSIGSPPPEPVPSSLDSRIKMLLGTQSPDSEQHEENSNSEDWVSTNISQLTSKSGPPSPQSPGASPTLNFPAVSSHLSSAQQSSFTLGFEDVSPVPLPDSAEEGEECQPSNEHLSKIPVISTFCSMPRPAQQPSHQTAMVKTN